MKFSSKLTMLSSEMTLTRKEALDIAARLMDAVAIVNQNVDSGLTDESENFHVVSMIHFPLSASDDFQPKFVVVP